MTLQNLSAIKPDFVQSYLTKTGWIKTDYSARENIKYELPNTNAIILLPKNIKALDYSQSLKNVIETLSQIEERSFDIILKNIMNPSVDTLRFRFIGSGADLGSLPLGYTLNAVESIRDALIYSACSELNTKPVFNRALKEATKIVEKSRFGQTELGSFVISVEIPLELPSISVKSDNKSSFQEADFFEPIQRRLIARIINSAQKARAVAIDGDSIDPQNDFKTNLNANLADALASLRLDGIDGVELKAVWDKSVPSKDLPNFSVLIEERTFDSLKSIGNVLRGSISSRFVSLVGKISSLSRYGSFEEEEVDNTVIIKTSGVDLPTNIYVALNQQDYLKACDCHRDNKRISINGTLEKTGRTWILTGYENFREIF